MNKQLEMDHPREVVDEEVYRDQLRRPKSNADPLDQEG